MKPAIKYYNNQATELIKKYEGISPEILNKWLLPYIPNGSISVLDIGSGSGRDAAWFSELGHDVIAIEPSPVMRLKAQKLHPNKNIRWIDDSLPDLSRLNQEGLSFHFILINAVWMLLPKQHRQRAFRKIINCLKPDGRIAITLRQGSIDTKSQIYPVFIAEIEKLARDHGAYIETALKSTDQLGRKGITWDQIIIRLMDDGTGAFPLIRHIVLNDKKTSTYKLGLLRSIVRLADNSAGLAKSSIQDRVEIPLGAVALTWLKLYKSLTEKSLPQSPINKKDSEGLSFAKSAYKKMKKIPNINLRIGEVFLKEEAQILHKALQDIVNTIENMPAKYITLSSGKKILLSNRCLAEKPKKDLCLNIDYLFSFGTLSIPENLWQAMRRYNVWIEPTLVAEWTRLIRSYAENQEKTCDQKTLIEAMTWPEHKRDVHLAKKQAQKLINSGKLFCVWSGKKLNEKNYDIDHLFPWSVWECGDLWNLLPSDRIINQKYKREKIPSSFILDKSQDQICSWWDQAYLKSEALKQRFQLEVQSSLPSIDETNLSNEMIFESVCLQRNRLRHDQQVPEWQRQKTKEKVFVSL